MQTKSAGYWDKSGGSVAHPFAASINTIQCPLFVTLENKHRL